MKVVKQEISYKIYESLDEMSSTDQELLLQARHYSNRSYSPYSKFKVGVAARLKSGQIIGGANQENASFPISICAEQTVLTNCVINHPNDPILKIAITAKAIGKPVALPVTPCGSCRQSIAEYEQRQSRQIQLILQGESGQIYVIDSIKHLLPLSFDGSVF